MSRRERRQTNSANKKNQNKKVFRQSSTLKSRVSIIIISLIIILVFSYLAVRDNSIKSGDLTSIKVTLLDKPKYVEYRINSTTYRDIILTTKEYKRVFKIKAMTYDATNHTALKSSIFPNDIVELLLKNTDIDKLDTKKYFNDYNEVYGIVKNDYNFINLDKEKELTDKDSNWAYVFIVVGLVMLPYGFIKGKPRIEMDKAVFIVMILSFLIVLLI